MTFPTEAEVIRRQVAEFQAKTPSERFQALAELIAFGEAILASSPNREAAERLREADRDAWRRAHRELMARHAT